MVLKTSVLIFVSLIFDCEILASNIKHPYNVIVVYAPNKLLQPVYTALDAIPGLQYRTELRGRARDGLNVAGRDDIDLSYYDDREDSNPSKQTLTGPIRQMLYSHVKGGLLKRKNRALPASYGGYTANSDTCKLYNHNLLNTWNILSKHINGHNELPDKMALHNIAQLIKAYLDHHDLHNDATTKANIDLTDKNKNATNEDYTETISKIKEILIEALDENTTNKIVNLILDNITSPFTQNNILECAMTAKEILAANVNSEFERFLNDSNCRRETNIIIDLSLNEKGEELNRNRIQTVQVEHLKMDLHETNKFLRQRQDSKFENCFTTARDTFLERIKTAIDNYVVALQC